MNDEPMIRDLNITADIIERLKDSEFAAEWLKAQDEERDDLSRQLSQANQRIAELETENHNEPERIASVASGCIPQDTFIRLRDWLSSEPRKAACNAFTAGIERQLAYVIERSGILEQGE